MQVEVRKVRTGSKRVGGIGDIDAWDGDRLILSAEAKHTSFSAADVAGIEGFCNAVARHRAIGLVVADKIEEAACSLLKEKGPHAVSRLGLSDIVALWDPLMGVEQTAELLAEEGLIDAGGNGFGDGHASVKGRQRGLKTARLEAAGAGRVG